MSTAPGGIEEKGLRFAVHSRAALDLTLQNLAHCAVLVSPERVEVHGTSAAGAEAHATSTRKSFMERPSRRADEVVDYVTTARTLWITYECECVLP